MALGLSGVARALDEVAPQDSHIAPAVAPVKGALFEGSSLNPSDKMKGFLDQTAQDIGATVASANKVIGDVLPPVSAGNTLSTGRKDEGIHEVAAKQYRAAEKEVIASAVGRGIDAGAVQGQAHAAAEEAAFRAVASPGNRETKAREGEPQADLEAIPDDQMMANAHALDQGQDQGLGLADREAQDMADDMGQSDRHGIGIGDRAAFGQEEGQEMPAGNLLSDAAAIGDDMEMGQEQDLTDGLQAEQSDEISAAVDEHTEIVENEDEWEALRKSSRVRQPLADQPFAMASLAPGEIPRNSQERMDYLASQIDAELSAPKAAAGQEPAAGRQSGPVQYQPERSWVAAALEAVKNA